MIEIIEEDIKVLDYIINTCYEKNMMIDETDLRVPKSVESITDEEVKQNEIFNYYKVYFETIDRFKIADITITGNYINIEPLYSKTEKFIKAGGVKKVYDDQQKEVKYQEVLREKAINDAVVTRWTKKTYWWTFGIAIAGFIIGVIALIIAILKQ
jgi:hypothetical protein